MLNRLTEPFSRVRRNHALEHATLQILAKKNPRLSLVGNSDIRGFWVFGAVSTEALQEAVDEARLRLKGGEHNLAIHPYCGTNFVTTGVLSGLMAWVGMLGAGRDMRSKLERLPVVITLVTVASILAQPLGPVLQAKVTTQAELGRLQVTEITHYQRRDVPVHRVKTRN